MSVRSEEINGGIPAHLADAFRELNERALNLSNQPYEPYEGQRFANFPKELQEYLALSAVEENPHLFDNALNRTHKGVRRLPQEYEQYLAPYRQEVTNKLTASSERNAQKMVSELEKIFGSGEHSRNRGLSNEVLQESNRLAKRREEESLARGHQAVVAAFGLDKARELESADILNKLALIQQASRLQDSQTLKETGLLKLDNEQRQRDLAYENWKERRRHPHESLAEYFDILRGVPYVRSSYERSSDTQPRQSWHRGDWMGLGGDMMARLLSERFSGSSGGRSSSPSSSSGGSGRRMSLVPDNFLGRVAQEAMASSSSSSQSGGRRENKNRAEAEERRRLGLLPGAAARGPGAAPPAPAPAPAPAAARGQRQQHQESRKQKREREQRELEAQIQAERDNPHIAPSSGAQRQAFEAIRREFPYGSVGPHASFHSGHDYISDLDAARRNREHYDSEDIDRYSRRVIWNHGPPP